MKAIKKILNQEYDFKYTKIYKKNSVYYFFSDNNKYYIYQWKKSIRELDHLIKDCIKLSLDGLNINKFVLNKHNNYYSIFDDKIYVVLMKNDFEESVDLSLLSMFWNKKITLTNFNLIDEWKKTIDEIEKRVIELNKEFVIIRKSLNYFIGLGENAISIMSYHKKNMIHYSNSIGHKVNYSLFEENIINNPIVFIKIYRTYDLSNYIKYCILNDKINYDELFIIFNFLDENEKICLFSNLLFPCVYFDLIANILDKKIKEKELDKILKNIKVYTNILKYYKKLLKDYQYIDNFDWI